MTKGIVVVVVLEGTVRENLAPLQAQFTNKYCSHYCFTLVAAVGLDKQGRCQILIKERAREQKV